MAPKRACGERQDSLGEGRLPVGGPRAIINNVIIERQQIRFSDFRKGAKLLSPKPETLKMSCAFPRNVRHVMHIMLRLTLGGSEGLR